jgi:hypothetical protein
VSHRTSHRGVALSVLLAASCAAHADPLPRVFFSSTERATITAQRYSGKPFEVQPPAAAPQRDASTLGVTTATAPPAAPGPTRARRIDGITLGRDARAVAWIGGERITDGTHWGEYRIRIERDGVTLLARDGSVRRVRVGMELPP